jgi:hypothetical protein
VNSSEPVRPFRRPPGRYGDDRRGGRAAVVGTVVLGVVFTAAVIALGWTLSRPDIQVQLRAYDVVDDRTVEVVAVVRRADPDAALVCVLRARDAAGREVGRRTVPVAPGRTEVVVRESLTTTSRAVLGELVQCRVA